jgi:hypothetical protein
MIIKMKKIEKNLKKKCISKRIKKVREKMEKI